MCARVRFRASYVCRGVQPASFHCCTSAVRGDEGLLLIIMWWLY